MRSTRIVWLLATLALGFAPAAFAYTIVLRNGTTLEAARKYAIRPDGKAIVVLPDGTTRLIEVSQIDVKKTEEVNRANDASVVVLDASRPGVRDTGPKATLEDMHRGARPSEAERAPAIRETPLAVPSRGETAALPPGSRRPFANATLAADLTSAFRAQGIDAVEIYQGSDGRRPLARISTANEAAIFQAIEAAAQALITVRRTAAESLATLELDLASPGGDRAGQFVLTPEQAQDLAEGKIDSARFFVKYVQF